MDYLYSPSGKTGIHTGLSGDYPEADCVVLDAGPLYAPDDNRWEAFAAFGTLAVYERTSRSEIISRCRDARFILTNKVPLDAATIQAMTRLEYIGVLATGFNIIDTAAAASHGVTVTNIPAYSTASVAQHAIALLLAITNRTEHYSEAVREGMWSRCEDFTFRHFPLLELSGKTFAVVGFGNTGAATAHIAAALGMKILVYTSKEQSLLPEGYRKATDLDALFKEADVLSLHCPLNDSTRGMVNADRLAMMKPEAIILNTARGPLVDEQALADALNAGRIAAAGLDVLSKEPPEAGNPLLTARNCFITPHIAWASEDARHRLMDIALANLKAFTSKNPQNVVN